MKVNMRPIAVGLTFPLQTSCAWLQPFLSIREHFRIRLSCRSAIIPSIAACTTTFHAVPPNYFVRAEAHFLNGRSIVTSIIGTAGVWREEGRNEWCGVAPYTATAGLKRGIAIPSSTSILSSSGWSISSASGSATSTILLANRGPSSNTTMPTV